MVAPQEKLTVNKGPVSGVVPAAGYHLGWVCFLQSTAVEFSQIIISEPLGQTCFKQLPWHVSWIPVWFPHQRLQWEDVLQWAVLLVYVEWRTSAVFIM